VTNLHQKACLVWDAAHPITKSADEPSFGENDWRIFGENRWCTFGENLWYNIGENTWYIIGRKMTEAYAWGRLTDFTLMQAVQNGGCIITRTATISMPVPAGSLEV